jgi:hypothetical protein
MEVQSGRHVVQPLNTNSKIVSTYDAVKKHTLRM